MKTLYNLGTLLQNATSSAMEYYAVYKSLMPISR